VGGRGRQIGGIRGIEAGYVCEWMQGHFGHGHLFDIRALKIRSSINPSPPYIIHRVT